MKNVLKDIWNYLKDIWNYLKVLSFMNKLVVLMIYWKNQKLFKELNKNYVLINTVKCIFMI